MCIRNVFRNGGLHSYYAFTIISRNLQIQFQQTVGLIHRKTHQVRFKRNRDKMQLYFFVLFMIKCTKGLIPYLEDALSFDVSSKGSLSGLV